MGGRMSEGEGGRGFWQRVRRGAYGVHQCGIPEQVGEHRAGWDGPLRQQQVQLPGGGPVALHTINFDVQSGSDTLHLTLTFTVTGINEAPTITFGSLDTAIGTIIDDTHATTELAAGTLSFKDPDAADAYSVSVAEVRACDRQLRCQLGDRHDRNPYHA